MGIDNLSLFAHFARRAGFSATRTELEEYMDCLLYTSPSPRD